MKELRTSGHSVPEISRITQTAKSSVLRHIKDTPIAREHMRRWLDRKRTAQILCMKRWDDASIRASTMVKHNSIGPKGLKRIFHLPTRMVIWLKYLFHRS